MKKKKQKYSLGTGKNGVVRHYIESPDETITESQIMLAKAREKAMSNAWGQGLDIFGNMAVQYGTNMMTSGSGVGAGGQAKFGGNIQAGGGDGGAFGGPVNGVNVNVEGEEVGETPDGQLIDFKGPSHENGGIDISLPEGTEIFSKRIKVKGKTMAERKMAREKKVMTLEKLLEKSGSDIVLKNSLKRTKKNNLMEEESDQKLQDMVGTMKQMAQFAYGTNGDGVQEFGDGGTIFGNLLRSIFGGYDKDGYDKDGYDKDGFNREGFADMSNLKFSSDNASLDDGMLDTEKVSGINDFTYADKVSFGKSQSSEESILPGEEKAKLPNFTGGDLVGLAGTVYSAFKPMENTNANRAGDTPNINAFKDFGNDALDRIDDAKGYIAGQRDKALSDVETSRTRITANNRNTARGVNTMRALDLASEVNANRAEGDIYDNFSKQMMQMLSQQAGFENQQDQAVMSGEQNRDLADRQDRDNYYTQMAQDIASKGEGIQTLGKMLNENKLSNVSEEAVNSMSRFGFTWKNGVVVDDNGTPATKRQRDSMANFNGWDTWEEYKKSGFKKKEE